MHSIVSESVATHTDGREVKLAEWSDGSVSVELWDGRFLVWDPNTRQAWDLTPDGPSKLLPAITSLEALLASISQVQ